MLMRILESAPSRYDFGLRLITLGRLDRAYDRLASHVQADTSVLDVGCGTGALTLRAARRGARVKAIDINAEMLEIARKKADAAGFDEEVEFVEAGVAELDAEASASYDAVISGLCFSELSPDEVRYGLAQIARILKPGGKLLLADEVRPPTPLKRLAHLLIRIPLVAITYLVTQQTTHAVDGLDREICDAGLESVSVRLSPLGSFAEFIARRALEAA